MVYEASVHYNCENGKRLNCLLAQMISVHTQDERNTMKIRFSLVETIYVITKIPYK